MHFLSMQELDRKSFPISEEPKEFNLQKTLQLLQQISLDLDHQTHCVLKVQRSQHKTIKNLQELLAEMKLLQSKVEMKISTYLSATESSLTTPPTTFKRRLHQWFCWESPRVKHEI